MIDWRSIQNAAKAWASKYTGLPAVMEDDPREWLGKAFVELSTSASQGLGVDEVRYIHDPDLSPAADMVPSYVGNRLFTLSVKIDSRSQDPDADAQHYLELLRTSLARPSVKAAFYAAGFSVAETLGLISQKRRVDGRIESFALMDLRCNTKAEVVDEGEDAIGYIERVKVSSTLTPSAGVDLDNEEMP